MAGYSKGFVRWHKEASHHERQRQLVRRIMLAVIIFDSGVMVGVALVCWIIPALESML